MNLFYMLIIVSPFLVFLILIGLGILRKKDKIVVEYGGSSKTYTLDRQGINNLKERLFEDLSIDPTRFEEQLKRYHSVEQKPLGTIKINQYKAVDLTPSLDVPFSQHKKYIDKIHSEFGYSLAGKIKNPIRSAYNNTKEKLPSKEETLTKTKDLASKGIDLAKNNYGVNKDAKTIINKKESLDESDYKTLNKLLDEQDKLLKVNMDGLTDKLNDETKNLTYKEIADNTEKYQLLEKHADKLEGLDETYNEAKKEAIASEIKDKDIEIADIIDIKNTNDIDIIPGVENKDLSNLENLAQDTDLLDSLIDKYTTTLQKELDSAENNKCNILYSIITYSPKDSTKKQIAETIKDNLINDELNSLKTEISESNDAISSNNIFDDKNQKILDTRKNLIYEINMLKENDINIDDSVYDDLKKSDDVIIENMVNNFLTGNIIYAVHNKDMSLGTISLNDFYENKQMIFDNDTSDAFCDIIKAMPPVEKLSKIQGIKGALGLTKKEIEIPNNYLADAILELIKYRKGEIDESKLSGLSTKIKPIILANLLNNSGNKEIKSENALLSNNIFDPKESPLDYITKRDEDNSLLDKLGISDVVKSEQAKGIVSDIQDSNIPNSSEIKHFEETLICKLKDSNFIQSEIVDAPENIISYLGAIEKELPGYKGAIENIIKRIESGDTEFISKESN
ncbi:MAG: hypothetical protein KAI18_01550 [Candidatus Aenigmarchaeota archaeon]|nr:hypothetical protein [Candidatus Aenigmarchaeota archaeon]